MIGRTNTGGGGGGGLNFSVVGGTTAPSNPKENMIWVNTSVAITTWVFSATVPENPVQGMVWISTGTSSQIAFNALKKNGIEVYPLSAKQCVSGAWVDKTTKIYQSGAWVDWIDWDKYLYTQGIVSDVLGGFTGYPMRYSDTSGLAPLITYGDKSISIQITGNKSGAVLSNNKINLTNKTAIHFRASITARDAYLGAFAVFSSTTQQLPPSNRVASNVNGNEVVHTLDVSGLSGEYYIGYFGNDDASFDSMCTIKEIWYE